MPQFEEQHEAIDTQQEKLKDLEPAEQYEEIWRDKVNKIQTFCDEKADLLEDDTPLEEGLAKVGQLLGFIAVEGAKGEQSEMRMKTLVRGLKVTITKIENADYEEVIEEESELENTHKAIDLQQMRLAGIPSIQDYKIVWGREVNKIQTICRERAGYVEDDTVLVESLEKINQLLTYLSAEGVKENPREALITTYIRGIEGAIAKTKEKAYTQEGDQSLGNVEEAETPMPSFDEDRMYGFAETPTRTQYQELVGSIQTTEDREAFIGSIVASVSENKEMGIEVTEQQSMRLEQLQLFGMMMQMFITEFGDHAQFLGSQIRNRMDEVMGIDSRGSVESFRSLIGDGQLQKYQYQIMTNPNVSLKDLIPAEAFALIEMRTTNAQLRKTEGLFAVGFDDPSNRTHLHEKKVNMLNWFRFYSHYGEVASVVEEDLKTEIDAAQEDISKAKMKELKAEVHAEMKELKAEHVGEWRNGYEHTYENEEGEKVSTWVPGMSEQAINEYMEKLTSESFRQKKLNYALKHHFDPNSLPPQKREIWNIYNDTFDPRDEYTNLADSTWDTIRKELMINAPLIMVSGGVGNLAKAAVSKGAMWAAGRMGLLQAATLAYEGSRIIQAGATVGLLLVEGAVFEATHSMLLKQIGLEEKWLGELDLPEAMQRIFWSTVALGAFHGAGKLAGGVGRKVDEALIRRYGLNGMAESITHSGTRKLVQQVIIAGNLEAATMLIMGAVQTGIYEGGIDAAWESLTSSESLFHSYLAAYSLKAGHMGTQTFKPVTGRGPSRRSKKQRDKPNPSAKEGAGVSAARNFVEGGQYLTSRGTTEVVKVDSTSGEVTIRYEKAGEIHTETMRPDALEGLISKAIEGARRPEPLGPGERRVASRPTAEVVRENSQLSDPARLEKAAELLPGHELKTPDGQPTAKGEAILEAHRIGESGTGEYTQAELAQKSRILDQAGFTKAERRTLMEHGITGESVRLRGLPQTSGPTKPSARLPESSSARLPAGARASQAPSGPRRVIDSATREPGMEYKPGDVIELPSKNGGTVQVEVVGKHESFSQGNPDGNVYRLRTRDGSILADHIANDLMFPSQKTLDVHNAKKQARRTAPEAVRPAERRVTSRPTAEVVRENSKLSDPARLEKATELLPGHELKTPDGQPTAKGEAILEAHRIGESGTGEYTQAELAQKSRILDQAGFTKAERRTLMEHGITGLLARLRGIPSQTLAPKNRPYQEGSSVLVPMPDGKIYRGEIRQVVFPEGGGEPIYRCLVPGKGIVGKTGVDLNFANGAYGPGQTVITSWGPAKVKGFDNTRRTYSVELTDGRGIKMFGEADVVKRTEKARTEQLQQAPAPKQASAPRQAAETRPAREGPYLVGEKVQVPRQDGNLSQGEVIGINTKGEYVVSFEAAEGPATKTLSKEHLNGCNRKYRRGQTVQTEHGPGTVMTRNQEGRYVIDVAGNNMHAVVGEGYLDRFNIRHDIASVGPAQAVSRPVSPYATNEAVLVSRSDGSYTSGHVLGRAQPGGYGDYIVTFKDSHGRGYTKEVKQADLDACNRKYQPGQTIGTEYGPDSARVVMRDPTGTYTVEFSNGVRRRYQETYLDTFNTRPEAVQQQQRAPERQARKATAPEARQAPQISSTAEVVGRDYARLGLFENASAHKDALGNEVTMSSDQGPRCKYEAEYGRPHNEDRVAYNPKTGRLTVIDGMGGMGAPGEGAVAADIFARTATREADIYRATDVARAEYAREFGADSQAGIVFASAKVVEHGRRKFAEIEWVGDVDVYVVDGTTGEARRVTRPDGLVQDMLDAGMITPEQAINHPRRNIVTNNMSAAVAPDIHTTRVPVKPGDRIVVATDGICDSLQPHEIGAAVHGKDTTTALRDLDAAQARNPSQDNRGVGFIDVH